jgi:aspartyl protease family protein
MTNFQNTDWQNFIYLSLVLLLLAGSIFSRRDLPWRKILQYLGIWTLVALIGISLYAYRFEFSDFKNRVLGEINPTAARMNQGGQIVIKISQDEHFYVNLEINGRKILFMVDTGASDMVINQNDARRIGIDLSRLKFNRAYQTANGTSYGASVRLKEVKFGDLIFHDVPASVNSADMGISLLGMSFLRNFRKYEFTRDQLILTL